MTRMVFTWQCDMARDVVVPRDQDLREHCHSYGSLTPKDKQRMQTLRGGPRGLTITGQNQANL